MAVKKSNQSTSPDRRNGNQGGGFPYQVSQTKQDAPQPNIKPNIKVVPKGGESIESLLRRFNREVMRSGVMRRMKELEFYEKPSARKKREKEERRRMKSRRYPGGYEWVSEE